MRVARITSLRMRSLAMPSVAVETGGSVLWRHPPFQLAPNPSRRKLGQKGQKFHIPRGCPVLASSLSQTFEVNQLVDLRTRQGSSQVLAVMGKTSGPPAEVLSVQEEVTGGFLESIT